MANLTKWKFSSPKKILPELIKKYGEPSIKDYNEGGLALWTKKDLEGTQTYGMPNCFEEMLLRDESVPHRCPASHRDFLYSYVLVDIGPDLLPIIHSISGSIGYDPLKKLLSARCGSVEANIATLKLATDILTDQISTTLYKDGLAKLYGDMIKATKDPEAVKEMYRGLCENLSLLGSPEMSDYWIGAFNQDCGDPPSNFSWTAVCDKADKISANQRGGYHNNKADKAKKPKKTKKSQQGGTNKADKPLKKTTKKTLAQLAQVGGNNKADKPQKVTKKTLAQLVQAGGNNKADKPQKVTKKTLAQLAQQGGADKADKPQKVTKKTLAQWVQAGGNNKADKPIPKKPTKAKKVTKTKKVTYNDFDGIYGFY